MTVMTNTNATTPTPTSTSGVDDAPTYAKTATEVVVTVYHRQLAYQVLALSISCVPAGVFIDSRTSTRARGSIPTLGPAVVSRVRGIPQVWVRVRHLTLVGRPVLLPSTTYYVRVLRPIFAIMYAQLLN